MGRYRVIGPSVFLIINIADYFKQWERRVLMNLLNAVIVLTVVTTIICGPTLQAPTLGFVDPDPEPVQRAPTVIVGDNIYVVWFTDKGMPNSNGEVIFRASNDSGKTFGEKINLSNTTDADSIDAEIAADTETVVITWWERNETSTVPVMRVSSDNGKTFGPLLVLGVNGTIGTGEAKPIL